MGAVIRDSRPGDADAVAAILRSLAEDVTATGPGLLHWLRTTPERAELRWWVAEEEGEVVGWARAGFLWTADEPGLGRLFVAVRPDRRRRGIGSALWEPAERHLLERDARRLVSPADDGDPAGGAFLRRRGFQPGRRDVHSGLDPRTVAPAEPPPGVVLVPLTELAGRERDIFEVYASGEVDMPTEESGSNLSFEEWADETLGHPDLSRDGSFVAVADGRPVALTFLLHDGTSERATNEMTATLPGYRGRGLATAVKVATSRWAAEHGITAVYTTNDETNAAMLAVNRKLGYRPVVTTTHWVRDEPAR